VSTFIIAEAGANHNRDWKTACRLVKVAAASGADAVKFQTYTSEDLYSSSTPDFAGYRNIPDLIRSIQMPREWHKDLKALCDDEGIEFMSTPFDDRAVDELVSVGVARIKIAAFEAKDPRILRKVGSTGLPVIFSAGVGTSFGDIGSIITILREAGSPDVTVLHCNSAYPTPPSDAALSQIPLIKSVYGGVSRVGYSDHTMGIVAPPVAVALGAELIEKHYTLDRSQSGPDHPFAIEPHELSQMVRAIRDTEQMLTIKQGMTPSESDRKMWKALRSVVTSRTIKKGSVISVEDVTTKRPRIEGSIPADLYYDVTDGSKIAQRDMPADHILDEGDIA